MVVVLGCSTLAVVWGDRERGVLSKSLKTERLRSEDLKRRGKRLADQVRRLRGEGTARLSPVERPDSVPVVKKSESAEVEKRSVEVVQSTDSREVALREVLVEMTVGEDLRTPVRLGTHSSWLPVLDGLMHDQEVGIKAWYFQALFPENDLKRVRELLADGLPDGPQWEAAAGFLVARSAMRGSAPLPYIDAMIGDESISVRVGAMSGLQVLMKEHLEPEQVLPRVMARVEDASDRVALKAITLLQEGDLLNGAVDALLSVVTKVESSTGERRARLIALLIESRFSSALPFLVEAARRSSAVEDELLAQVKHHSIQKLSPECVAELAAFLDRRRSPVSDEWTALLGPVLSGDSEAPFDWDALMAQGGIRRVWAATLQSTLAGEDPEAVRVFRQLVSEASAAGQVDRLGEPMEGVSARRRAASMQRSAFVDGVAAEVRRVGVEALLNSETHLVLPALVHLLGDSDSRVRLRSATGLARHSIRAGIDYLREVIASDPESRFEAMQALLEAKNAESFQAALSVVGTHDNLNTWYLVDHCIQSKRPLPMASIREMLKGGVINPWRADSYLGCFEASVGSELNELLSGLLVASEIPEPIQHLVIRWLANSGEPRLSGLLVRFLNSDVAVIREATLYAMSCLDGHAVAIDRMLELANDDDPFVLAQLCYCLASTKNPMATNALVTLSKHKVGAVREVATRVLGGRRHPTVLPALKGRLSEDRDGDVVNASLLSLVKCHQFDHISELFEQVDDVWVGGRTLRFLKSTFGRDLQTRQDWVSWWELNGEEWLKKNGGGD